MPKKYVVELTADERQKLDRLVRQGHGAARKRQHAQVLLKADSGLAGPAWTDAQIAEAFSLSTRTVERIRQRLVEDGLEKALERRQPVRTKSRKLDGEKEARLIALVCSAPPEGRSRWTLRLLADQLVRLEIVEAVDHTVVWRTLKKMRLSLG